jgi:hypothetical protein
MLKARWMLPYTGRTQQKVNYSSDESLNEGDSEQHE